MKVINVKFSDVAYVNGLEFRRKISVEQPVLVVVNYRIMPFITLMFYPPLNSIWRIYPSMTVCYDEHLEGSDADAELMVDEEIQIAGGKMPIAGILNFSDFFEKSNEVSNIGPWRFGFNTRPGFFEKIYNYLKNWWYSLGDECTVKESDELTWQWSWWEGWQNLIQKDDACHFMLKLWELNTHSLARASSFANSENSIDNLSLKVGKSIVPAVEAVSKMPGKVMREMIIKSGMPNKRAKLITEFNFNDELKKRDILFYKQCALVRRLNKVSMYWRVKDAISSFERSLALFDYTCKEEPMEELKSYTKSMVDKFPVLAVENL